MNIGILGGTFDPPHFGHLGMATHVLKTGQVDEIWFIPCLTHRFGKAPTAFAHRVAMCRLLIDRRAQLKVSEIEKVLNRPGYTLDLVERLRSDHPMHRFFLIAGQDIYHQKAKWHHYDEIAALAPPIYVARVGERPIPEPVVEAPPNISSSDIRRRLSRNDSVAGLLPDTIRDYIEVHHLYAELS